MLCITSLYFFGGSTIEALVRDCSDFTWKVMLTYIVINMA